MNRISILTFICAFAFGFLFLVAITDTDASLIIQSNNNVVYDDVSGQYWVRDLNMFEAKNYSTQISEISLLNSNASYSSYSNSWHLAKDADLSSIIINYDFTAFSSAFIPNHEFIDWGWDLYYGRTSSIHSNADSHWQHHRFFSGGGWGPVLDSATHINWSDYQVPIAAWVTSSPIPEPTTMLLFGLGILGLAGVNRKKIRSSLF